MLLVWQPPPPGFLKFSFDVAFKDGKTITGCLLRNSFGTVGAWLNHFVLINPFYAETEAAIQALTHASTLNLDKVLFEGDAANVIYALNGMVDYED